MPLYSSASSRAARACFASAFCRCKKLKCGKGKGIGQGMPAISCITLLRTLRIDTFHTCAFDCRKNSIVSKHLYAPVPLHSPLVFTLPRGVQGLMPTFVERNEQAGKAKRSSFSVSLIQDRLCTVCLCSLTRCNCRATRAVVGLLWPPPETRPWAGNRPWRMPFFCDAVSCTIASTWWE